MPVRGGHHLVGTIKDILVVVNCIGWYNEVDILLLRQTQWEAEQIKINGIGWQVKYTWHIGSMPHKFPHNWKRTQAHTLGYIQKESFILHLIFNS